MKINLLDSTVYNRISAGEVVERPASIVKELVENSIDAGATEITITIKDGGTTSINIIDNGIGIDKDDVKNAFLPHATSKIKDIDDLDTISTLGFRGEALPSIASIAMVTLKTKTKNSDSGKLIEINASGVVNESECAMNTGTNILVENIFYNTPARRKFLKSNKAEEKQISNLISRLIMTNPSISFTYYADDKKIFQTYGTNLFDALNTIYGKETTTNIVKIENTFGNYQIKGYIGNYNYSKGNKTYQTIIINNRYVQDKTISTAVATAYGEKLMKRTYPFFVLELIIPFDEVDCNVHPAKTEVRFVDERKIFSFVYHSVQDCLINNEMKSNKYVNIQIDDNDTNSCIRKDLGIMSKEENTRKYDLSSFEILKAEKSYTTYNFNPKNSQIDFSDIANSFNNTSNTDDEHKFDFNNTTEQTNKLNNEQLKHKYNFSNDSNENNVTFNEQEKSLLDFFEATENSNIAYSKQETTKTIETKEFTGVVIGQLFDTYLLVEDNNEFFLIDQHAVHEKIIYDELINANNIEVQNLLIPYIFDTNFVESEFLMENLDTLNNLGIGIEHFGGNSFKINSIPISMINNDLDGFVKNLLKNITNMKNITSKDILKEKISQTACKSAIKAGYKFNKDQQKALLKYFIDNGMPTHCPHGRPTMIKFTKQEIEKMFKRIV